jgi:hypothetical protein
MTGTRPSEHTWWRTPRAPGSTSRWPPAARGPDSVRAGPGRAPGGPGAARVRGVRPAPPVRRPPRPPAAGSETTTALFSLDETAKYFLVLTALRDGSSAALPTDPQTLDRLRRLPSCRRLTRSAVNFHLDYLARTKLRLREPAAAERPRLDGRRAALVSFALRFDLVRDEHLTLLPSRLGPV